MSNYTEKTSGAQIKALLSELFPRTHFIENDFSFPYDSQCNVRIDDAIGVNELTYALEETKIDPRWIVITTDAWGHLTIVVCNYDGTDIEIED